MKRLLGYFLGSWLVLVLAGCATAPEKFGSATGPLAFKDAESASVTRKLIKHSSLEIEVEDVSAAERRLESNLVGFGGYIASSHKMDADRSWITCRVPQRNLQVFVENLRTLGEVLTESLGVEDVTNESSDKQAELENLHLLRERYRALLSKAETIAETLSIEAEIASLQTRIDRLSQSLKGMERGVQYSNVDVEIKRKVIDGPVTAMFKGLWWGIRKLFVLN